MTKIIGIDPSLSCTGWAILENSNYISSGLIKTNPTQLFEDRIFEIFSSLTEIIKIHNPEICGIEETFVSSNPSTSLKLYAARGAIIACVKSFNLKIFNYTPTQIKKAITGSGRADKTQILAMIKMLNPKLMQKTFLSDDETDAIAIGMTCELLQNKFL